MREPIAYRGLISTQFRTKSSSRNTAGKIGTITKVGEHRCGDRCELGLVLEYNLFGEQLSVSTFTPSLFLVFIAAKMAPWEINGNETNKKAAKRGP
jgi:hypothetical protein